MRHQPTNWYALGYLDRRGVFRVRRIVSGRLLARHEKGDGETIRPVALTERLPKRRGLR